MAGGGFTWSPNTLSPGMKAFPAVLHTRLSAFFSYQEKQVQDYMRNNAPWTDRTGNARQGLFARAKSTPAEYTITVYHTVPYGIWLEVRHSGQYAIIQPTITHEGARIMRSLGKVLSASSAVA